MTPDPQVEKLRRRVRIVSWIWIVLGVSYLVYAGFDFEWWRLILGVAWIALGIGRFYEARKVVGVRPRADGPPVD